MSMGYHAALHFAVSCNRELREAELRRARRHEAEALRASPNGAKAAQHNNLTSQSPGG